ncbi:translocation/assembly module TamB domain-containing protein [Pseudomonas benzenivorans]|uniref:translocation/assembly module TamB domain-containing protein n=1 Tax=Pseudomonas benzenivorans TaxID=556533 RepID=UPI0035146FC4
MRRGLRCGAYALLGVIALVALALWLLLGTSGGSRWALERVPGLKVEGFEGRLGGRWQAERLTWHQDDDRLVVQAPLLEWSPRCLWRLTLCVARLQAERVELQSAPSTEPDAQPLGLPDLQWPLAVELGELRIGSLLIDDDEPLHGLQLSAHWQDEGLSIDRLAVRRGGLQLELQGRLQPQGAWPLSASGRLQLPAPDKHDWQLALEVDGDLLGSLRLSADSSGYLQGRLSGEVQPLAENLPATARLIADGFMASGELPPTLRLDKVELSAGGDLASGYRVQGTAELPGEGGALALALQGRVDLQGAEVAKLSLEAGPEQHLHLSGRIDWQEALSLDSRFHWQDFPWRRLLPEVEEPPVSLRQLRGELAYQDGHYLGHFAAQLQGPAGDFNLQSPLSGDLRQLFLPDLRLQAGQGRATGQLSLGFAEGLRWDARLQLSDLDPAYWLAELPGRLAGPLNSSGELQQGRLRLEADIDLDGRLRGQPARLQAQASGAGEHWTLRRIDLRLGDNRIQGSGALQERLSGQLQLALPRLGQLWPQLQGQLEGRLDLAGSLQVPQGRLRAQGRRLAVAERRVQRLELDARLDATQQARIELQADGIALGETELGRLSATGRGDARRQQLQVQLEGPLLRSTLDVAGELRDGAWHGRLRSGEVHSGGQDWRLQQPAGLLRRADGRLELGAHCWRSGPASLCGETQRLLPEPQIRYRLADFPLDSLSPWLPKDFAWQGQLDAEIALDLPPSGPRGRVTVDAGRGSWRIRDQDQWLTFGYDELRLDSQLRPAGIDTRLALRGPKLGELSLQATLDPRSARKPLSGSFRLSGLDLALARPFVPRVEQLAGRLEGSGSLGGELLAPRIDGRVQLRDGEIGGGELPSNFRDLQLQANIAGERLQLDGGWRSGEQGRGELSGELTWASGLQGQLRVRGRRLPVSVEPYAELEVEPDLRLSLAADQLALSGKVAIPRGKIQIRELPPSTVQLSDDAVIVGQDSPPARAPAIAMDIDVEVGQDRLSFSGFGLRADLAGRVHIGDDLDTRGELNLNNGRFRAYGQRLTIRRARLLFAGPIDQPFLDIEAIRRVDQVVAGLRLSGRAEQPRSEVFSEPAMSQEQALSYLVLGRPQGQGSGDNNLLAQAALAMGLASSASLTGGLAQRLGIEDFQLDSEGSGVTTSVVASGNLSERLSLRYGVGVFEPANTLALRYQLSKRLYLEAASGLASSLDLFYRRDF